MKKGVDGGYGKGISIETRVEKITPMMRRLVRPYFRVGIILSSVCLSCGGRDVHPCSLWTFDRFPCP